MSGVRIPSLTLFCTFRPLALEPCKTPQSAAFAGFSIGGSPVSIVSASLRKSPVFAGCRPRFGPRFFAPLSVSPGRGQGGAVTVRVAGRDRQGTDRPGSLIGPSPLVLTYPGRFEATRCGPPPGPFGSERTRGRSIAPANWFAGRLGAQVLPQCVGHVGRQRLNGEPAILRTGGHHLRGLLGPLECSQPAMLPLEKPRCGTCSSRHSAYFDWQLKR